MTVSSSHCAQPDPFAETFVAMAAARAVITATRLGVLDRLASSPATAPVLADALGLDHTGTEAVLSALASLGYVSVDLDLVYRPTAAGLQLTHGAGESIADFVGSFNAHVWEMLGELDELLLGRREADSHNRARDDPYWADYIRGLYALASHQVEQIAQLVPATAARRMLEIGGGHAAFAIAMCRAHPQLSATILDLPASAAVGRTIVAEQGLSQRIGFREGDALIDELGESLDLVAAFNVLHHLPQRAVPGLLRRIGDALRTGGILIIGDTLHSGERSLAGVTGAMSGLIYYVSSGTRNFTREELVRLLEEAGFTGIELHTSDAAPWRVTLLARAQGA